MFLCSCGFNFTLLILFGVSLVSENMLISNISFEFFDLIIALYSVVIPGIILFGDKFFKTEFLKLFCGQNLFIRTSRCRVESTKPHLKTVLGEKLIYDPAEEAKKYFDQLAKTWNEKK